MTQPDADEVLNRFRNYYSSAGAPVLRELERRVLGAEYGGNGYTDVDQAREVIRTVGLSDGSTLLDVGAGAGWPGLFLAKETGCTVALTDVPVEGMQFARGVALREHIRAWSVSAAGDALPFAAETFDVVGHFDVLC